MIDPDKLMTREFQEVEQTYTVKDSILYALGLGLGQDPLDQSHLGSVYEGNDRFGALPSMVNVIGHPWFWAREPSTGLDWKRILHGEQSFTLHDTLPSDGTFVAKTKITGIVDKGPDKGALIYTERQIFLKGLNKRIGTVAASIFARGDGGFGGGSGPPREVHGTPEREPDIWYDFKTALNSALIYRLSGDMNPLHVDPRVAKQAGFVRPILHGLCTLGIASWSITETLANQHYSALKHLQVRFSAPVYPGETVRIEMWNDGEEVSFRARVLERDTVVLKNGLARLNLRS